MRNTMLHIIPFDNVFKSRITGKRVFVSSTMVKYLNDLSIDNPMIICMDHKGKLFVVYRHEFLIEYKTIHKGEGNSRFVKNQDKGE